MGDYATVGESCSPPPRTRLKSSDFRNVARLFYENLSDCYKVNMRNYSQLLSFYPGVPSRVCKNTEFYLQPEIVSEV